MSNQPFNNDTDQQTRRRVERDTYLSRAQVEADQVGGRFKKEIETHVTGVPTYPSLPASSPWASPDPTGLEPPLGYSVDQMDASLDAAAARIDGASSTSVEQPAVSITSSDSMGGGAKFAVSTICFLNPHRAFRVQV